MLANGPYSDNMHRTQRTYGVPVYTNGRDGEKRRFPTAYFGLGASGPGSVVVVMHVEYHAKHWDSFPQFHTRYHGTRPDP